MGIIDLENVRGYHFVDAAQNEVVCTECITKDEKENLTEDDFLMEGDLEHEEKAHFCDRCKKRI
ncbi:MAG: hypothetical protein ABSB32_18065 [Thermodesulfobacteriota bacterium]|jgi:hypothetical protein